MSWQLHRISGEELLLVELQQWGPTQSFEGYPSFYVQQWHLWLLLEELVPDKMSSDNQVW